MDVGSSTAAGAESFIATQTASPAPKIAENGATKASNEDKADGTKKAQDNSAVNSTNQSVQSSSKVGGNIDMMA